jgi:hypothetical protein
LPDFGYSRDALRAIVGLSGEFVGTTDTQAVSNKTINVNANILTSNSAAQGDMLKGNGTQFLRMAIGTPSQVMVTSAGGTDIGWGTAQPAGGGTGVTTLTGVAIGNGQSAFTAKANPTGAFLGDSDVQNITGAKTFTSTTLALRNPAGTFTGTLVNPAITSAQNLELEAAYSYIIYKAGTTIKRMNTITRGIESSGTTADVQIQAAIDALGNDSGKSIFIKNGLYTLTAALNFTAINGKCRIVGEHGQQGPQFRPSGDFSAMTVNKPNVTLDNLFFTHNQSGYTSSLVDISAASATVNQININNCSWYDFGHQVGNGLSFTATGADITRVNVRDCLIYGFNNSILGTVGASPRFCNGVYFFGCQFWFPIRGLSVNIGTNGGFDNNNFYGCQIQAKVAAPNQTECGFDYETNNLGDCLYTSHHGCIVWDLGATKNYANVTTSSDVNIELHGCVPSQKIGGAGAASGYIRAWDQYTVNRGKSTQSGNASTKVFNIAHRLITTPTSARITAGSSDATGNPVVTFDATNVILTYPTAPPSGTNNLIWNWEATVF